MSLPLSVCPVPSPSAPGAGHHGEGAESMLCYRVLTADAGASTLTEGEEKRCKKVSEEEKTSMFRNAHNPGNKTHIKNRPAKTESDRT